VVLSKDCDKPGPHSHSIHGLPLSAADPGTCSCCIAT
jgi:hypothetical protein